MPRCSELVGGSPASGQKNVIELRNGVDLVEGGRG